MNLHLNDLRASIDRLWNDSILERLEAYIRIPNKSPNFDPEWEAHGHMEAAVQLMAEWCRAHAVPGMGVEVRRIAGRTPLLLVDVPGELPGSVLLYGHLDKQPEFTGWAEGLAPWTPVLRNGRLYGRGGADDGYAVFSSLAAILALIPLAVGFNIDFVSLFSELNPHIYFGGDNAVFWKPLSWTIIFGLAFAFFMTLFMVPSMYLIAERLKNWKEFVIGLSADDRRLVTPPPGLVEDFLIPPRAADLHLVGGRDRIGIFHGVGHAGAAAVLDADTHARDRLLRFGHDGLDALGGGVRQPHHLGSGPGSGHFVSPVVRVQGPAAESTMVLK